VSLVEQALLTLPEHMTSSPVFCEARVTRSLVVYVCFDYPFGIFKLFFLLILFNKVLLYYLEPLVVCCQIVEIFGIPILTLRIYDDGCSRNALWGTNFDIYHFITISWLIPRLVDHLSFQF